LDEFGFHRHDVAEIGATGDKTTPKKTDREAPKYQFPMDKCISVV
jgi:hypothetical protein